MPVPRRRTIPLVLSAVLLWPLAPPSAPPAQAIGYSPVVDAPSGYDGQTTCVKTPRPGTVALAHWLLRSYRVTRSLGMIRGCGSGGQSEHKDGRAFDWGADAALPATRAAAYDFITKALATDDAGNEHALARRLGIMYFIYNDTIWSSYRGFEPRPYLSSGCRTKAKCSRTLRHLNHVHISLGYAGAAAQTSWYRARNIASDPVYLPGTQQLDPELTAVTGFTVPATGAPTRSPFVLRAGVSYRLVATGTTSEAGGTSDAICTRGAGATAYEPGLLGLTVLGAPRWEGGCSADHTYETWFTPLTNQRLQTRYVDAPATSRTGTFTVYVARADITLASLARK